MLIYHRGKKKRERNDKISLISRSLWYSNNKQYNEPSLWQSKFRFACKSLGFTHYTVSQFSTHSLRAGGATAAANAGVSDRIIQSMVDGNRLLQRVCTLKTTSQNSWKFPKLFRVINLQRKLHKFLYTNSHLSVFTISYAIELLVKQIK